MYNNLYQFSIGKEGIMEERIIEIETERTTGEDDSFEGDYTYISNPLSLLSDEEMSQYIKADPATNFRFSVSQPAFYNNNSAFDSIYSLGKLFKEATDKLGISTITDIDRGTIRSIIDSIMLDIQDWIEINGYPYFSGNAGEHRLNKSDLPIDFIRDSINLYVLYDIHKWLIKINREKDTISEFPNQSPELNNLVLLINYINLLSYSRDLNINCYIANIPKEYDYVDTYEFVLSVTNDFSYISSIKDLVKYTDSIRDLLFAYLKSITNSHDFVVTKQLPFKVKGSSQVRIRESANSIMGIAYQKLLFHLTSSTTEFKREICHAPGCNNEFVKASNRQLYCQNPNCQSYRNSKKSKNWDDKHKKKKTS